jgi:hypothetical protein
MTTLAYYTPDATKIIITHDPLCTYNGANTKCRYGACEEKAPFIFQVDGSTAFYASCPAHRFIVEDLIKADYLHTSVCFVPIMPLQKRRCLIS